MEDCDRVGGQSGGVAAQGSGTQYAQGKAHAYGMQGFGGGRRGCRSA